MEKRILPQFGYDLQNSFSMGLESGVLLICQDAHFSSDDDCRDRYRFRRGF